MEYKKNSDVIHLIFKMKTMEKSMLNTLYQIKGLKVKSSSLEEYYNCINLYHEGSCYFFQCCGFLKSQYFESTMQPTSKNFLINGLCIPSYKKFMELKQCISKLKVDDIYVENLKQLLERVELINCSFIKLIKELQMV